jgi:F-type H+-transporting ATPase subunit gamma
VRKAQDRMQKTRPYANKIIQVIHHLAEGNPEYQHAYLVQREIKRVGYIVVSSDRGLCGSLNHGLFKRLVQDIKQKHHEHIEVDLCVIGTKAESFFRRYGGNVVGHAGHLGDMPNMEQLIGIVRVMFEKFETGQIDAVYIAYNNFVNTMQQTPVITSLLPIAPPEKSAEKNTHWDYIYEMDARDLITLLVKRYVESQVYQGIVENIASEHAARMVAMKNATENAGELIDRLNLVYNKARQAAITTELAEIVAGAEAV